MKVTYSVLLVFAVLFGTKVQAQEFIFPSDPDWNILEEGDSLSFTLKVEGDTSYDYKFSVYGDRGLELHLDSLGNFNWVPSYDLVDRVTEKQEFSVIFEAISSTGNKIRKEIPFTVMHKNRPPSIGELPVFYVRQYSENEFNLKQLDQINDPDDDPIVFKSILSEMPEGASLSELGIFSWKPSRNQFRSIRREHLKVHFLVQDQPEKSETMGTLIIAPTQLDLPPEILMVPNDTLVTMKEDEVLNLNFYVSDPNGDDNIRDVSFVSNDLRIPKSGLTSNTATQWEFTWTPGYDFVGEQERSVTVEIVFYVLDESNKRAEKSLKVEVLDTENLEQKDKRLYAKYKTMLIQTMDMIDQLDENQKNLNKQLKRAKKGKRHRSIVNASLGAVTGISPVFMEDNSKDYVTGVGGTAVLTLGTLEATEVLGKSKDDILERLKLNIDIRNALQAEGDQFARKYALRSQRRDKNFFNDVDKLKAQLNNKKMILLELDASWENPTKPSDKNLKKQFPDFNNEGFED
ncbi:hypothetical protein LVD15_10225 [Fulvivirga maritima]|uniref:Ig-like domain-containing protein n=1 Tax=Fulvivirga maritima TaxID=2904247 RepID=UPI001F380797|nr:Ig-like domain-containing protein [Fulvivirga maritima]UII28777.1 hypothetical protein LVD15_10225 [Fulvivirga maritima]